MTTLVASSTSSIYCATLASDPAMVINTLRGLNSKFSHAISVLTARKPLPAFLFTRDYLLQEESRQLHMAKMEAASAMVAAMSSTPPACPPPPQSSVPPATHSSSKNNNKKHKANDNKKVPSHVTTTTRHRRRGPHHSTRGLASSRHDRCRSGHPRLMVYSACMQEMCKALTTSSFFRSSISSTKHHHDLWRLSRAFHHRAGTMATVTRSAWTQASALTWPLAWPTTLVFYHLPPHPLFIHLLLLAMMLPYLFIASGHLSSPLLFHPYNCAMFLSLRI
jgi:hypothetical protein